MAYKVIKEFKGFNLFNNIESYDFKAEEEIELTLKDKRNKFWQNRIKDNDIIEINQAKEIIKTKKQDNI